MGRLEELRAKIVRCEHGVTRPVESDDRAYACPIGHCDCCLLDFPFIDSGWEGFDGSTGTTTWEPRNRCGSCGGEYRTVLTPATR